MLRAWSRRPSTESLPLYSRAPTGLDILGIEPRMWGAVQTLTETYSYLAQRRLLTVRSNLGGLILGLDSGHDSSRGDSQYLG